MIRPGRVAVAMSGGVDSAVAAARLVEDGVEVFGLMLRLWVEEGRVNRCCSPADVSAARQVAAQLGIPFYVLDMQQPFHDTVVRFFLDGYAQGVTPNPCIECNRTIRWSRLLSEALSLGATHLATGHYARVRHHGGRWTLLRAVDTRKDQSYVLSVLGQDELAHARFPLGDLTKAEVRQTARRLGLPVADRPESQDLCFLAGEDYRQFLGRHAPGSLQPGPIVDTDGAHLGQHSGLAAYTLGQRRGIGIAASTPLYVVAKDTAANRLVVGPRDRLSRQSFSIWRTTWIDGRPPRAGQKATVQVRYRAREVACRVYPQTAGTARLELESPLDNIAPGQSAAIYTGARCLGSGVIAA